MDTGSSISIEPDGQSININPNFIYIPMFIIIINLYKRII